MFVNVIYIPFLIYYKKKHKIVTCNEKVIEKIQKGCKIKLGIRLHFRVIRIKKQICYIIYIEIVSIFNIHSSICLQM